MKKDSKQRLFEVMSRLDKTFKPVLNENVGGGLSPEEQQILNDIVSVNESGGDWWSKFVEYGRKGMLTAAVVLALAFSTQAQSGGKTGDVIKTGIEMTQGNHETDLLNFLIGFSTQSISGGMENRNFDNNYYSGLKSVREYAITRRDGGSAELDDLGKAALRAIYKYTNNIDANGIQDFIDFGATINL